MIIAYTDCDNLRRDHYKNNCEYIPNTAYNKLQICSMMVNLIRKLDQKSVQCQKKLNKNLYSTIKKAYSANLVSLAKIKIISANHW